MASPASGPSATIVISEPGPDRQPEQPDEALRVGAPVADLDRDPAREPADGPDELGRGTAVEPGRVEDAEPEVGHVSYPGSFGIEAPPAAASATSSSDAPMLAWTAGEDRSFDERRVADPDSTSARPRTAPRAPARG